jgi:CRP-like cAMP-binding protein
LVTAVANTPVELVGLSKSLFLQLVCSNPELEVKLRAHAQEIIAETESFIATRLREVARMVIAAQRMKRISERNEDGSRSASSVAGTDTGTDDDDQVNRLRY